MSEISLYREFPLVFTVPMYVIGMIETQFFAYLQLIRYRFCLLNKLLVHFGEMINSNKNNKQIATFDKATQIKSDKFEYFINDNNICCMNVVYKYPTVNCTAR